MSRWQRSEQETMTAANLRGVSDASERRLTNALRQRMRDLEKQAHWSHDYPGHEERILGHTLRIRGDPCPCGSGRTFGKCCCRQRRIARK